MAKKRLTATKRAAKKTRPSPYEALLRVRELDPYGPPRKPTRKRSRPKKV